MTPVEPYGRRQQRTAQLLSAYPHAAEMLGLYSQVLERQLPLYRWGLEAERLLGGAGTSFPGPSAWPFDDLGAPFRAFVGELAGVVPAAVSNAASALVAAPTPLLGELLMHTATQDSLGDAAAKLGCEVPHLAFLARAFLQPLAETLAARDQHPLDGGKPICRRCSWPPQVAVLRDEPEVKGRRYLICALCASWWPFPRTTCPGCGESDAERLPLHQTESTPHLRIEECATCRAYLKSVDLRRDGFAVPEVDDIASVELDLWAEERGLWKLARNLLGM